MERREFLKASGITLSVLAWSELGKSEIPGEPEEKRNERMKWWREAKFGMFIHWGIYAVLAGEWNGKQCRGASEWIMNELKIPVSEYEKLASQFNPVKFDAQEWVSIAKNAGMKYLVITSKHHDGFCMFDSQLTNYDIMDATPFKRDVLKELSEACQKQDIRFGLYHSILDWHHPDQKNNFPRYVEYMKGQLRELLSNYGPIGSLFFDGDWILQWTTQHGKELEQYCRSFQPELVINDRAGKRPIMNLFGNYEQPTEMVGDYLTPEQTIPRKAITKMDWETCMTMNNSWGYKKSDQNWKSSAVLIRHLIDIASKGGNFLLNVGPTAEGIIPEPSVERLREIGKWMAINGESIYGTTAGPLQNLKGARTTQKPGKIYLHIFDWQAGKITLSGIKPLIKKVYLLADSSPLKFQQVGKKLEIILPEKAPDPVASVIVIEEMS